MAMKASPPSHHGGQCAGRNPNPGKNSAVRAIAYRENGAAGEPHSEAGRHLHASRSGKARAQPVKEPQLYPVTTERRPEQEQRGNQPACEPAPESGKHGAKH
jgi:hypothetical protein